MKRSSNRSVATRLRALLLTAGLVLAGVVGVASPASAHDITCGSYGQTPSFACVSSSGYNGQQPWGYPVDSNGHNCTNYVSYRLWQNGVANPGNLGNAYQWDEKATGYGIPVNGTPAVGSVAVWEINHFPAEGGGHVAYVEAVTSTYIDISEDNFGGTTMRKRFYVGQSDWPDHFIHFQSTGTSGTWGGVKNATFLGDHHLVNGQQMHSNQYIMSDDGRFVLLMQTDGNLVEYTANGSLWASNTAGHPGAYLGMQSDGNVVIYSSGGTALWSTGPKGIQVLKIQTDGNLVARNSAGTAKWANNIVQDTLGLTYKGDNHLNNGQTLVKKEYLRSSDRRYTVVMHSDGRLNVYAPGWRRIWTSNSGGHSNAYLGMQSDGNVVIYTSDGAVWATDPKGIQVLKIQDDGNLVARNSAGTAVWATGTDGKL